MTAAAGAVRCILVTGIAEPVQARRFRLRGTVRRIHDAQMVTVVHHGFTLEDFLLQLMVRIRRVRVRVRGGILALGFASIAENTPKELSQPLLDARNLEILILLSPSIELMVCCFSQNFRVDTE